MKRVQQIRIFIDKSLLEIFISCKEKRRPSAVLVMAITMSRGGEREIHSDMTKTMIINSNRVVVRRYVSDHFIMELTVISSLLQKF